MNTIKIAVNGAVGRMGQQIIQVIHDTDGVTLSAGFEREGSPYLGHPVTNFPEINYETYSDEALKKTDVVIDFSAPSATIALVEKIVEHKKKIVIGTTGLNDEERAILKEASTKTPVLFAPNMSVGVNLLFKLVEIAAKTLGDDYDVEIVEAHHKLKKDAPSGTAVKLAEVAVEALGRSYKDDVVTERDGIIGERDPKEIGVQTIRGGDVVGDHTVFYFGDGERVELTHKATNRNIFAKGSVRAAMWINSAKPGFYDMFDVLNLK